MRRTLLEGPLWSARGAYGAQVATTLIVKIWLWLAGAVILLGYASIWWSEGFGKLQEIMSPFIWNLLAVLLVLAPGFGLLKLGEHVRSDKRE